MIVNGTDYTLPVIAAVSFLVLFAVQFVLCHHVRSRFLRHLPWIWVILVLALAVAGLFGDTGGWIDLRSFFALLLCGYAAVCAAGIALAHLIHKLQKR